MNTARPWIVGLGEVGIAWDEGFLGGKARRLAILEHAGFPVPPGFCVTAEAYRHFIAVNGISAQQEPDEARRRLLEGVHPHDLRQAIVEAYHQAGAGRVAVRSSAVGEDGGTTSFAGQQLTRLRVAGEEELLGAIVACWASLWSEAALSYRRNCRQAEAELAMGVVVQRMIEADLAGVGFTVDPVTGADNLVIEAATGLGEAVVGGIMPVQRFVVDRRTQQVSGPSDRWLLEKSKVLEIGRLLMGLEELFQGPQDVEWCLAEGRLHALQSRPVTGRVSSFFTEVIPGDNGLWASGFLNERFPHPLSPLGWTLIQALLEPLAFREPLKFLGYQWPGSWPVTKLYRGHPFVDARVFEILYKPFPDALLPEDARRYFPGGDTQRRRLAPYPTGWADLRWLFHLLKHFLWEPEQWSPFHNHRAWRSYLSEHERIMALLERRWAFQSGADRLKKCIALMREAQELNAGLLRIHRWSLMHADLWYSLLRRLLNRWMGGERGTLLAARLVTGLSNKSLELNQALARCDTAADWEVFLRHYGHRSFCLDIYDPTFAESPSLAKAIQQHGFSNRRGRSFGEDSEDAEAELTRVFSGVPGGGWRRRMVAWLAQQTRHYLPLREDQRFYWQQTLAFQRRLAIEAGMELSGRGWLGTDQDVFFLTWSELMGSGENIRPDCGLVDQRREEFHRLQKEQAWDETDHYPLFLQGNTPWLEEGESARDDWRGQPISPGRAKGMARVILNPGQFERLQPEDILVTRGADPAWTPVFGRLGGLVLEVGGQLSHGAVVAREYHLPAVAAIPGITRQVCDGEWLLIDGNSGVVRRCDAGTVSGME
ncbi:MAG TPA: PEP/pyruvate-binding domain-containing protein [Candidatus Paceibacterota bacterium]|nr:PEP/pyruvate-binding domain-containing protein [Verrucomicrobiota bacterium]HRY51341.1 PEP/pyruvate-binding domain-containing protein [Candidatus Paceibacterota bacterium]HSA02038.1 PEP/pyruvate-binding domain-containing protein [Candidatus Paceibacterota bacterium]